MTGELKCDCDDGWVSHDGNCYQYSTQAWCPQGEILQVKKFRFKCLTLLYYARRQISVTVFPTLSVTLSLMMQPHYPASG